MKKFIAIMLAALMVLGLAACGNTNTANTNTDNTTPAPAKKTITVATSPDFAPMEFVDTSKTGQEQFVGFDMTLAKFIADYMGAELEIKPMDFNACMVAVQTGSVDMAISGFSWKEDRAANFELSDFYDPGNESAQVIIVLKENAGKWKTAADYKGLTVGVQAASLQEELATKQLEGATIKQFIDIGTEVEALKAGKVDAIAVAQGNGKAIISSNDNIAMSGFEFEVDKKYEANVILIKKGNTELLAEVNKAMAASVDQHDKWYEDAQALAGIDTAADISYDENGNPIKD